MSPPKEVSSRELLVYPLRGPETSGDMNEEEFSTHQKSRQINLDASKYGTFAEIGAGQEVLGILRAT